MISPVGHFGKAQNIFGKEINPSDSSFQSRGGSSRKHVLLSDSRKQDLLSPPLTRKLDFPCHAFVANSVQVGGESASACNGACKFPLGPLAYDSAAGKLGLLNGLSNDKVIVCHDLS